MKCVVRSVQSKLKEMWLGGVREKMKDKLEAALLRNLRANASRLVGEEAHLLSQWTAQGETLMKFARSAF